MLKTKIKLNLIILLYVFLFASVSANSWDIIEDLSWTWVVENSKDLLVDIEEVNSFSWSLDVNNLETWTWIINTWTWEIIYWSWNILEWTWTLSESEIALEEALEKQKKREESARIFEEFKNQEYQMLFENVKPISEEDIEIFNTSSKANIYEAIKEKVNEKKKELEEKRDLVSDKIFSLEKTINDLEDSISKLQAKINKASIEVIKIKNDIEETESEIVLLQAKIEENRKVLLDYIIHLYKKGNIVLWNWHDIDSLKAIILGDWNMWDILSEFYFKWILEITWQKLIDKHRQLLWEIFLKKISLSNYQMAYDNLRKRFISDKQSLKDKVEFREKILDITKWKQSLYEKYIKDKASMESKLKVKAIKENIKYQRKEDRILEKYDCDNLKDLTKEQQVECIEMRKYLNAESKLKPFNDVFIWPVIPENWLSAFFHDKEYERRFWSEHDAIDILAEQWTQIVAPADWYVLYVKDPVDQSYSYLALQHADWYVSVYGHLSKVLVNKYDFVKAWEPFAETGWAIWAIWAWYMSTGPHLHFELFKDKMYVDPISYLDISYLSIKDIPDEKYIQKYYMDYKNRYWKDFNKSEWYKGKKFTLEWENEVERQKSLLNKYAVWSFNDWNMWIEEGLEWKIDPTFLMCIWLAETWLGRYLKTPYNVWNIWNTDSWATRDFPNARAWIYWMVKTLNNKYLGKYDTMNMLSRYWNPDGSIYASSPDHWHNNIVKCVSVIKWRYIKDTFKFRLDF